MRPTTDSLLTKALTEISHALDIEGRVDATPEAKCEMYRAALRAVERDIEFAQRMMRVAVLNLSGRNVDDDVIEIDNPIEEGATS